MLLALIELGVLLLSLSNFKIMDSDYYVKEAKKLKEENRALAVGLTTNRYLQWITLKCLWWSIHIRLIPKKKRSLVIMINRIQLSQQVWVKVAWTNQEIAHKQIIRVLAHWMEIWLPWLIHNLLRNKYNLRHRVGVILLIITKKILWQTRIIAQLAVFLQLRILKILRILEIRVLEDVDAMI